MTFDLISESQKGSQSATLFLVEKFNPLLKKYAYKLYSEDAYEDLLLNFIELIHNIKLDNIHEKDEGHIISYICTSIHRSYIKRLTTIIKQRNIISFSNLSEKEVKNVDVLSSTYDKYFEFELLGIQKILSKNEMTVIEMVYLLEYTIMEIACSFGVSRQAVNQTKKRALKKLNYFLVEKPYSEAKV